MPSAERAFTERMTGAGGGSMRENVSSQPAGFFASSSRRSRPWNWTTSYRPATACTWYMRSSATCGGTPNTAATAAEEAALALLARPGSWRWIGQAEPCGSRTWSPDRAQLGVGRRKPHSPQYQSSPGRCMTPPQDGQDQASSFHIWPAATQITLGEDDAAHTTSGSSQLATTTAFEPASPSRQFSASMRVSAARSSWSRERLSRAMHFGAVSRATPARYFSSTSMTPYRASEPPASAEVMPAGMLAPSALETTGPAARRASAMSRVVVVLPLVAETRITSRFWASRARRSGSSLSATRPPITEPLPRPAARDAAATALPAVTASLARGESGSELPAISSRSSLRTRRA